MPKIKIREEERVKIGVRLREIREEVGLTQNQVEKDTGLLQKAVSSYERNKTIPPLGVLVKLSEYYHVTLDYLVYGERDKKEVELKEKEFSPYRFLKDIEKIEDYEQRKAIEIVIKNALVVNEKK